MAEQYFAHTPAAGSEVWQTMNDHLSGVANRARQFGSKFNAADLAELAGWLHDIGKYSPEFQKYLKQCHLAVVNGTALPRPGAAEHKSVGARAALLADKGTHEALLALCVAGHHGGLMNCSELTGFLMETCPDTRASDLVAKAKAHCKGFPHSFSAELPWSLQNSLDAKLRLEMLCRFVFSCLVDADALDCEAHFEPEIAHARAREAISLTSIISKWQKAFTTSQEDLTKKALDTPVNRVRRQVYENCLAAANGPRGVYSLTVPTGGGKTRSSLAFALHHAQLHQLERIIYAAPYTSIIDQTPAVFRDILGTEGILEHHSAVDAEARTVKEGQQTGAEAETELSAEVRRRILAQNWDSPLIVTTTVQLLESLFSNRTSRCRKLHNIANSVIILDEVQSLPFEMIEPLTSGLKHLVDMFGVTLVLCTATQPPLQGEYPALKGFESTPIIPDPKPHFAALQRVTYNANADSPWDLETLACKVHEQEHSCLVVLNTRKDALEVLDALGDPKALHLSTLLCSQHRKDIIKNVTRGLEDCRIGQGEPVRLVTTQVIESGVDIDFPCVFRAMAPLERIIQAAGRCNREGRRKPEESNVFIFELDGGTVPRGYYRTSTDFTRSELLRDPYLDLSDPQVVTRYLAQLMTYVNLDRDNVQKDREYMRYATVAGKVRLIKEDTVPVLVPYHKEVSADAELSPEEFYGLVEKIRAIKKRGRWIGQKIWQLVNPLTVALYRHQISGKLVSPLLEDTLYVWEGQYCPVRGIGAGSILDPADIVV